MAYGTGFCREAWRPALAEIERKRLKNIEENGEMALGQSRLMRFLVAVAIGTFVYCSRLFIRSGISGFIYGPRVDLHLLISTFLLVAVLLLFQYRKGWQILELYSSSVQLNARIQIYGLIIAAVVALLLGDFLATSILR